MSGPPRLRDGDPLEVIRDLERRSEARVAAARAAGEEAVAAAREAATKAVAEADRRGRETAAARHDAAVAAAEEEASRIRAEGGAAAASLLDRCRDDLDAAVAAMLDYVVPRPGRGS
jgi:vacuolar-type H+-ATPase subunit H